jgi:hypothetical protein
MTADANAPSLGARPLRDSLYGELIWRRRGVFRRELQLESGSELVARLRWTKWHGFEAVAEAPDGSWLIDQPRRFSLLGDYRVRDATSGAPVAALRRSWRGTGVARFESGAEYRWQREGFWRPRYHWSASRDRPLITFRSLLGFGGSYEMTVDPAARGLAELPVLVVLGTYVMALISARSHAG